LTLPYTKKYPFFESVEKAGVAITKNVDDVISERGAVEKIGNYQKRCTMKKQDCDYEEIM